MVKDHQPIEFSAAQTMALAMLGYYRWLPREMITARAATQRPIPIPPPEKNLPPKKPPLASRTITPSPVSSPVIETPLPTEKPLLIPLAEQKATLNVARDYVILKAENLPCVFLLPPFWANGEGLHCFATPAEKQLWLNAWQAIDIPVVLEIFTALFKAQIPIQIVPDLPLHQTLGRENLPVVCVGALHGLTLPPHKTYFSLSHPWFLLQKPLTKKTFWLELLALKEKLF